MALSKHFMNFSCVIHFHSNKYLSREVENMFIYRSSGFGTDFIVAPCCPISAPSTTYIWTVVYRRKEVNPPNFIGRSSLVLIYPFTSQNCRIQPLSLRPVRAGASPLFSLMSPDLCSDLSSPWLILWCAGIVLWLCVLWLCVLCMFIGVSRLPRSPQESVILTHGAKREKPAEFRRVVLCIHLYRVCPNVSSEFCLLSILILCMDSFWAIKIIISHFFCIHYCYIHADRKIIV